MYKITHEDINAINAEMEKTKDAKTFVKLYQFHPQAWISTF